MNSNSNVDLDAPGIDVGGQYAYGIHEIGGSDVG
jgi:hypothetical protein